MTLGRLSVIAVGFALALFAPACGGGDDPDPAAVGTPRTPPDDFPLPVPVEAIVTSVLDFTTEGRRRVVVSMDVPGLEFEEAVRRYETALAREGFEDVSAEVSETPQRAVLTGTGNGEATVEIFPTNGTTSLVLSWSE